jgi:hypothetical protein
MRFQADDLTDPSEIRKAAKRFFSGGTSGKCREELLSKTAPICTVNLHVVRYLSICLYGFFSIVTIGLDCLIVLC